MMEATGRELPYETAPEPPMVKGWPLIGSTLALARNPLDFLRRTHAEHGEVYTLNLAGHKVVVLAGVEANRFAAEGGRDVLSSVQFWRDTLAEMECPHSFIGVDGPAHQYQRNLMKPMFAKSAFTDKLPALVEIFHDAFARHAGARVEVAPFLRHLLSRQIGGSLQDYQPSIEEVEALMRYQTTVMNVCSLRKWPRAALRMPAYQAAKRRVHALADKIIASTESGGGRYLDVLIEEGQKKAPQWFTAGDVRNHAIISFLAGIDTMGSTLSFMLRELFRQPEIRAVLQREVDDAFADGMPDVDGIERMENVRNFVREVMRLYPAAFALRRTAKADFVFRGYQIRRGQNIILFTTANHTDPAYFKDPEHFELERYAEPRLEHRTMGAYAAFGRGPHACIGAGLANILLPLNLALMLRHADIQPACNLNKVKMDFSNPVAALSRQFTISLAPRAVPPVR